MMDRRGFLERAGALVAGLTVLRHLPAPAEAPTLNWPEGTFLLDEEPLELALIRDSTLTSVSDYQLFAESFASVGGLCAPLSPIYEMPSFARPVKDALPAFTAKRGLALD